LPQFEGLDTLKINNAADMKNLGEGYMISLVKEHTDGTYQAVHAMVSIGEGKAMGDKNDCCFNHLGPEASLWQTVDVAGNFHQVNGKKAPRQFTVWASKLTDLLQRMTNQIQNTAPKIEK
jgi:hypothetical protein